MLVKNAGTAVVGGLEGSGEVHEIVVLWGESVLDVVHVPTGERFSVGSEGQPSFLVAADQCPGEVLLLDEHGPAFPAAIEHEYRGRGALGPAKETADAAASGARALGDGEELWVAFGDLRFRISRRRSGAKIAGAAPLDRRPMAYVGMSAALSAVVLGLASLLPPASSAYAADRIELQGRFVEIYTRAQAVDEPEPEEFASDDAALAGDAGQRSAGDEGAMGDEQSPRTTNRYGVEGPEDNPDPHLARQERREQAATAGILGTLAAMQGSFNAPTSPFGRETALGNDPANALGALMGDNIGGNFGFGGLGLRGTGIGAGGTGEGTIGLDSIGGTLGRGCTGSNCQGGGGSYGRSAGRLGGRRSRGPVSFGRPVVRGSLSREVIRREIGRHRNEIRFCYEQGLRSQPGLEGRVTTRFIISTSGAVSAATATGLRHRETESCVAQAVRRMSFPVPEGSGIVSVTYPFVFRPSE